MVRLLSLKIKPLLPTYDVFDEARYFEPAKSTQAWECDGKKIGLAICEDLWAEDPDLDRNLYGSNPIEKYEELSLDLMISISASPYQIRKTRYSSKEFIKMSLKDSDVR